MKSNVENKKRKETKWFVYFLGWFNFISYYKFFVNACMYFRYSFNDWRIKREIWWYKWLYNLWFIIWYIVIYLNNSLFLWLFI